MTRFHLLPRARIFPGWMITLLACLVALSCWELAGVSGHISSLFFPVPSVIFKKFIEMAYRGGLVNQLKITLLRLLVGMFLGGGVGLILGFMLGWSNRFRSALDPLVALLHPVPKIAVFPLIMVVFGIGEVSKIVVISLAAFFPIVINAMAGVQQIHPVYFKVAKNYGANSAQVFRKVVVPGSIPSVLAGTRIATNTALVLTITVELLASDRGLGAIIWMAWETLRVEELYVGILAAALLGIGFNVLFSVCMRRLAPWGQGNDR
jgi:ABC-type nitrate/sulfonate/bicarbonate transport system permease component